MTPDERDLRRALDARSATLGPDFQARIEAALAVSRRMPNLTPAISLAVVFALTLGTVGVLVLARRAANLAPNVAHVPLVSAPRLASPSPNQPTESPTPFYPGDAQLSAPSDSVLWDLVDNSFLYRSIDGGRTWQRRPLPGSRDYYTDISFIDDRNGWLALDGPGGTQCSFGPLTIWHTTDAGASWQQILRSDIQTASEARTEPGGIGLGQCKDLITFVDSRHGFLTAWDDNSPPTIYRTSNGGVSWSGARLPDPPDFRTIGAGDALVAGPVLAFGGNLVVTASGMQPDGMHYYVFRSTDGGIKWRYLARTPERVVIVTASRWLTIIPILAQETLDGGKTFHPFTSAYSQAAGVPPRILFVDSLVGYATVRGEIQRTADGGVHWSYVSSPGAPST